MIQITITRRIQDKTCSKCGDEMEIGNKAMVARNQSGKRVCMKCYDEMRY